MFGAFSLWSEPKCAKSILLNFARPLRVEFVIHLSLFLHNCGVLNSSLPGDILFLFHSPSNLQL